MLCIKAIPKAYILYDFISLPFLKWQNFKNDKMINMENRLVVPRLWGSGRQMYVAIKGQNEGSSGDKAVQYLELYHCQHPGYYTVGLRDATI